MWDGPLSGDGECSDKKSVAAIHPATALRLFPKECPRVENTPELDSIVCEFLKEHDVHVTPVASNIQPSRLTNAAMGAISPYAVAANTAVTQQQKAAALQEWTTWKQWALSHSDFPAFKEQAIERARTSGARQQQWIKDNEERIKEAAARAEEQRLTDMKQARRLTLFFLGLIVTVSIAGQLASQYAPKTAPASTEQRGS